MTPQEGFQRRCQAEGILRFYALRILICSVLRCSFFFATHGLPDCFIKALEFKALKDRLSSRQVRNESSTIGPCSLAHLSRSVLRTAFHGEVGKHPPLRWFRCPSRRRAIGDASGEGSIHHDVEQDREGIEHLRNGGSAKLAGQAV